MYCWIYPSPVLGREECLIVPEGILYGDLPIAGRFGSAELWKTIELENGAAFEGLNEATVLADLANLGYHIASVGIAEIEEWPGWDGMRPGT